MNKDQYIKIAREYESKGRRVLARELGISEAYLSKVVEKLRAQGVNIPLKRVQGKEAMEDAIRQLKSEQEPPVQL